MESDLLFPVTREVQKDFDVCMFVNVEIQYNLVHYYFPNMLNYISDFLNTPKNQQKIARAVEK